MSGAEATGTPRKSERGGTLHALSHEERVAKVVREFDMSCGVEVPSLEDFHTVR